MGANGTHLMGASCGHWSPMSASPGQHRRPRPAGRWWAGRALAVTAVACAAWGMLGHQDGAAAPAAKISVAQPASAAVEPVVSKAHLSPPVAGHQPPPQAVHAVQRQAAAPAPTVPSPGPVAAGAYSYAALEQLWVSAGGPSWAEAQAASIAICESAGEPNAYNPSGASGLWQILGQVVPGNIFNPYINALNAVSKFKASGDTFSQWVCKS